MGNVRLLRCANDDEDEDAGNTEDRLPPLKNYANYHGIIYLLLFNMLFIIVPNSY